MQMIELINKKKYNKKLTQQEIKFIVAGYSDDNIPDYQMSAFLMAVWFNGFDEEETFWLTESLVNSGVKLDLSSIHGFKADKHSTGGIGDKVSFLYAPLLASFGVKVVKMSGKGLGQTGGTIDKLEAIPNFNVNLNWEQLVNAVNECNMSIVSQTQNLTPADKKIYALRDATGIVDSMPLIAASVMAKKIAMNSDGLVLDVKWGNGSFMSKLDDAQNLTTLMLKIAKHTNIKTSAIISNMNQPLGRMIGNLCEVKEAYEFLQGKNQDADLYELTITLTALSLLQANKFNDLQQAKQACKEQLASLKPLKVFQDFIIKQNGDFTFIENFNYQVDVKNIITIKADTEGYVNYIDCYGLGNLAILLGAGREKKDDVLDYMAGIFLNKKTQEHVKPNDIVLTLFTNKKIADEIITYAKTLFKIEIEKPHVDNIIHKIIT